MEQSRFITHMLANTFMITHTHKHRVTDDISIRIILIQCVQFVLRSLQPRGHRYAACSTSDNTPATTHSLSLLHSFSIYTHRMPPNRIIDCCQLRHLRAPPCVCNTRAVQAHVAPLCDIAWSSPVVGGVDGGVECA